MMKKILFSVILLIMLNSLVDQAIAQNNDNLLNLPPIAICQDIFVSANDSCVAIVDPILVDSGSYDPDGDSLIFTLSPEGPYPIGINEVMLTVTDTVGDYDQCTASITVVDDSIPTVLTQSVVIYLDSSGMASITPANINSGSFDNCGIDTMYLDVYDFSCENIGYNMITLSVTDFAGNSSSASDSVTVMDTIPPHITVTTDIASLWPPNHKYEDFELSDFVISVWDNCPNVTEDDVDITYASSDEPENGEGDGNTYDDIVISNECKNISVRKERQGGENGRVYTIQFKLDDGNDQVDSAYCYVFVPHNPGSTTFDDGAAYKVNGDCSTTTAIFENEGGNLKNGETSFKFFPNPFLYFAKVEFYLSEKQDIELEIYNVQGKLIKVLYKGILSEGKHSYSWNGQNTNNQKLDKGIYFIRLITNEKVFIKQIVKM
ncbi:MAG: hypothetical protein DRH21_05940 [Deltaproteobacteria bacterium]|nr:MAG: hypothetical protein DRH21_05940 [Deltaproteobacteria bacterium]